MLHRNTAALALAATTLLIVPAAGLAASDGTETTRLRQQIETLRARLDGISERLATLEQRLAGRERDASAKQAEPPAEATAAADGEAPGQPGTAASTEGGHLKFNSRDGDFEFQVGGRLMADAAVFNEDSSSLGNGTEIRRARLFMSGTVFEHWAFKNQVDFAGNDVALKDAYLRYTGLPATITVGHFKEPFSLEELTSSKYITFMERALPNVFAPARNLGVAAAVSGAFGPDGNSAWSAALGIFGDGVDNPDPLADESVAVTGRLTFAPIATDTGLLHLGAAASFRDAGDLGVASFSQRMEAHIADRRLLATGPIDATSALTRVGAELAAAYGPFALQAEYMRASLDRAGMPDPALDGFYVYGSWFPTGESRAGAYSGASGKFGRLHPRAPLGDGGPGAWELAARYSEADLNDAGVNGGLERNLSLGINWYPRSNLRFMADYVEVLEVEGGPTPDDKPTTFQLRAQVDF